MVGRGGLPPPCSVKTVSVLPALLAVKSFCRLPVFSVSDISLEIAHCIV